MGSRKQQSAVDAVARLIQRTHDAWKQKQMMGGLFMDVKGAFDHVNPGRLVARMVDLGLDGNLTISIRWTQSFLTDRQVQLVIDNTQCSTQSINSGSPRDHQCSPFHSSSTSAEYSMR